MQIPFSFKHMFLSPGKTFAVPTVAGARVRVVDGMVWATTSSSPDDVWLKAGEEHTVERPGLTVIESIGLSTVELIPPVAANIRGRIMNRYEAAIPRAAFKLAAAAMTVLTIALMVVLPAKVGADGDAGTPLASGVVATTPREIGAGRLLDAREKGEGDRNFAQATNGAAPPTSVQ